MNIIAVEYVEWSKGGFTKKVFKQGFAPDVNDENFEKEQQKALANAEGNMKNTLKLVYR